MQWARAHGVVVCSDECYLDFAWEAPATSVLHPDVCGGDLDGIVVVSSLSKRSNLAGYRAGVVTGDSRLVSRIREFRKHAGLLVPSPVQAAMAAVVDDEAHVAQQRERYRRRREVLFDAVAAAGLQIEESAGGLYLWVTRDGAGCWDLVGWFAERGILVGPGSFYGSAGNRHVRLALTASDAAVNAVKVRIGEDVASSSARATFSAIE